MTRVNPLLIERLETELGLSPSQVYRLVARKVNETHLPRHLAAVALASDFRINISRFATEAELAEIRKSLPKPTPPYIAGVGATPARRARVAAPRARPTTRKKARRGKSVFVVHGRDDKLRRSVFSFLRALGLEPIEWRKAIGYTGKPSPYVGEILDAAFSRATAVVVLLTPDDEAQLKPNLRKLTDPDYEKRLTGQPRPNVLFEAGMAFGRYPEATVLVQVGQLRPLSDVMGRHTVHLSNSIESRWELVGKLRSSGCDVDTSGVDWTSEGDFDPSSAGA